MPPATLSIFEKRGLNGQSGKSGMAKVAWKKWHGKSGMAKVAWQKLHGKSGMAKVANFGTFCHCHVVYY